MIGGNHKAALWVALVGALLPAGFAVWAETSPITLVWLAYEDGPIEDLSAILFLVASLGFVVVAVRSRVLRGRSSRWAYFFTLSWAALMAVFVGEEISWGQRILGVPTPEFLGEINAQSELNVHNIAWLYEVMGGPHAWLTLMMLLTGLVIPLASRLPALGRLLRYVCFPVAPLRYAALFVVPVVLGTHYHGEFRQLGLYPNTAWEVRELIFGIALAAFALHGARWPDALFLGGRRRRSRSAAPRP